MASRDKVDVDAFHKGIQYALERLGKSKLGFERTAVSNFKSKTRGLWPFSSIPHYPYAKKGLAYPIPSIRQQTTTFPYGNRTEWSTIQGVIGRVISKSAERKARGRFKIKSTITPELYDTKVLLLINRNYNKIREEYDSGINYLTG